MSKVSIEIIKNFLGHDLKEFDGLEGDELDAKVKASLSANTKKVRNEGIRTRMLDFEKAIRDKHGVEYTQEGEALVDAILNDIKSKNKDLAKQLELAKKGSKLADLSPEEAESYITNHAFFQSAIQERDMKIGEWKDKYEAQISAYESEKLNTAVKAKALEVLTDLKPKLLQDESKANYQKEMFVEQLLRNNHFKLDDKGNLQVVDKEGRILKDKDSFKDVGFDEITKTYANRMFDFHPIDPNKNAPGRKKNEGGTGKHNFDFSKMDREKIVGTLDTIKDPDAFEQAMKDAEPYLQ